MDFTLKKYESLLWAMEGREVIWRHDVDLHPERSLEMAKVEAKNGIKAIYYFRAIPQSWDEQIIKEIASLGHEIGYHYESLTTCKGDIDAAWEDFQKNLEALRRLVPVHTVCMHGSPRSKWDNRDMWGKYDYHTLGIDFEPYMDTDWSETFYLTDTGRRWDGFKVSVRDRIPIWQEKWNNARLVFHSTDDIIKAANAKANKLNDGPLSLHTPLPQKIMITTHPQRWTGSLSPWTKELVMQSAKNIIKRIKTR